MALIHHITCRVPQGSTLCPLFLLYINDLNFSVNIASHFADDTCIMFCSSKPKTLENVLNCEPKKISDWLKANKMVIKCQEIEISLISKEAE